MFKVLVAIALLTAAGFVVTQYLGKVGTKSTDNAKIANEVLAP